MAPAAGHGSHKFFRLTLLNGKVNDITDMLRGMEREAIAIEKEIATVVFYTNGGLAFDCAYDLSMQQLKIVSDIIQEHYAKQAEAYNKPTRLGGS